MPMQTGAVAMIDALGFKGIWGREKAKDDPDVVVRKLRDLRKSTIEDIEESEKFRRDFSAKVRIEKPIVRFLSDTIFAGVPLGVLNEVQEDPIQNGFALHGLIGRLSNVLASAATNFPTLVYRGCITLGRFTCDDVFILGQAVDEVASMMNEAEGAFVWLSPRGKVVWEKFRHAMRFVSPEWEQVEANIGLVPYSVPLKNGACFNTYAVSPFASAVDPRRREDLIRWTTDSFDAQSLEVQVKKQHTLAFLDVASRLKREAQPSIL